MKYTTRNLLVTAAVLAVLGGASAALKLTKKKPETASSAADNTAISLLSEQIEDVQSMQVKDKNGGFVIVPKTTTESAVSGTSSIHTTYTVQGLEGLPLYRTATENVIKDGFSLVASRNAGSVSSLKDYGLDSPAAEVQADFKNGTSFDYLLSNEAAGSDDYYIAEKDSDNVYVVSVDGGILNGVEDFVQKELCSLTNTSSGQETPAIDSVSLSNTHLGEQLSITNKNSSITVSDGKQNISVDDTQYSTLAAAISVVTTDEVTAIHPAAEQIKQYGLGTSSMTLSFTTDRHSHTLKAGNTENGVRYIMVDNIDAIFGIKEETASTWATATLFSLRSKFVQIPNIIDVNGLDITADNETYTFEKTRTKNASKSTEDSEVYDYTVTCNGKAVTYGPNFQRYYQNVVAVRLLKEASVDSDDVANAMNGQPAYTVRFRFYDTAKKPVTVQYYIVGDRRYLVVVDSIPLGLVIKTSITGLIADAAIVAENGMVQAGLQAQKTDRSSTWKTV